MLHCKMLHLQDASDSSTQMKFGIRNTLGFVGVVRSDSTACGLSCDAASVFNPPITFFFSRACLLLWVPVMTDIVAPHHSLCVMKSVGFIS